MNPSFLLVVCILVTTSSCMFFHIGFCSKTTPDINTDMSALLILKSQLIVLPGNSYSISLESNWSADSSTDVCSWIGVSCGARHRRVTALDLSSMGLVGVLPPHIGNLSFLTSIFLYNNSFHGSIPSELFRLRRLQYAYLKDNQFTGPIPSTLFLAPSLRWVSFQRNSLHGSIPNDIVSNTSSSLQVIDLTFNNLTGELPEEIFHHLPHLNTFTVSFNMFTGPIPSSLCRCRLLQMLSLSYNAIGGSIPPEIGNLTLLTELYLGYNKLTGAIPSEIAALINSEKLNLVHNALTGEIPSSITNLTKLIQLGFASNNLTGPIPQQFGNHLQSSLHILDFTHNHLSGPLPLNIFNISSLVFLHLGLNQLQGTIPLQVGNLENLVTLDLSSNQLSGTIPTIMGELQNIQYFDLSDNRLEGPIPHDICKLSRISYLYLERNAHNGSIPACVGNLSSLRELSVSNNMLSMEVPTSLWNLRDLLVLGLCWNSLSGPLPQEIGNLKAATWINFANNQFTGSIPPTIGSLITLQSLSFAGNKLDGSIPNSFGNLISLQYLDLSRNNLSGVIPKTLEKLLDLEYFNASINRLEGEIPDGGPFVNLSAQSFILNGDLCGSARFAVPRCKNVVPRKNKKASVSLIKKYVIPIISAVPIVVLGLLVLVLILVRRCRMNNVAGHVTEMVLMAKWRRVSYYELVQATNQFHESNLLGVGAFGSVFKGTLSDGMDIAVKVFNQNLGEAFESFHNECEVMRNIRHMNLVKVITSCSSPDLKCLIMEYMPNGSLDNWLYNTDNLNILQRLSIVIDVANALEYLHHGHSVPIIHCDLKPSNILLDEDMVAHVTDFGISKILTGGDSITQTLTLATFGYTAPEYGLEGIVSTQGDVYSYGIMLMETFAGKRPTDEMFAAGMSLPQWVQKSLPHNVHEVVDFGLLNIEDQHFEKKRACIYEIMKLALACCSEKREDRPNISEISTKLKKMHVKLLRDPRFIP